MLKTQFEHGEWVEVKGFIRRYPREDNPKVKTWVRFDCPPFKAIFLGGRKLSDCEHKVTSYMGDWEHSREYDDELINSNFQDGALVCQKNRNPVKVLLSDVHKIPQPTDEKLQSFCEELADILNHFADFTPQ